jgi:capsular polysaccharide transport system permease protein
LGRLSVPPFFLIVVALPTLIAAIYYLAIAAPEYVSETTFVVRTPTQPTSGSLDSVLLGGLGGGGGAADAYVIQDYITSRQAVHDLEVGQDLRAKLARPTIDLAARFPRPFQPANFENLYQAYKKFIDVGMNGQTGISTLRVTAFTPKDASDMANALLDGGEGVINRLNDRAAADAVAESHKRISEAEARVVAAETALTDFRNREQLIDPQRSSLAGLDLVAKLEGQLADMRAQRAAIAAAAPSSPQLPEIDRQITAFQSQLDMERSKIAGQDTSLAPTIGEYEQLTIERDFAVKELAEASAAAETARLEVRRKRLYLERIVSPNTPDTPTKPRRLYSIMMVLFSCLLIYGTVVLVMAGLREHGQH